MRVIFTEFCTTTKCGSQVPGQIMSKIDGKHKYAVKFQCAMCGATWIETVILGVVRNRESSSKEEDRSLILPITY